MSYRIKYSEKVIKEDFKLIGKKQIKQILLKINKILTATPEKHRDAVKPLKGNLKGLYRLRSGVYRIIYKIYEKRKEVYILKVGHIREIYERFLRK